MVSCITTTARKYRPAIKTNAYDLLFKTPKSEKKLLFTNIKLAVTIDHVIALLFNVSLRPVPLLTNVRRNSQVRIISL